MRNILIVSSFNHIARFIAPIDDYLSFPPLDGKI